jgi:hypothetical protein
MSVMYSGVELQCDQCYQWELVYEGRSVRVAREIMKRKGWTTRVKDGRLEDICASCVEAGKQVVDTLKYGIA